MGSLLAAIDVHILAGTADRGAVLKICGTSCLWATRAFSVVDPSLLFALGFLCVRACVCARARVCVLCHSFMLTGHQLHSCEDITDGAGRSQYVDHKVGVSPLTWVLPVITVVLV